MTVFRGNVAEKISWNGELISVQPRIRLSRSFDQRSHTYLGYTLMVAAVSEVRPENFSSELGKALTPNTISGPVTLYPGMRCRWPIRVSRPLNFIRSAI